MDPVKLAAVRAEVKRRLEANKTTPQAADFRQPRYDDVFFEGTKWLDSLAETDDWGYQGRLLKDK